MKLSPDIVSQFAKLTNNKPEPKKEATVNGTFKIINGEKFVQIDGSDIWTPVDATVDAETGERVKVQIKNHTATVVGNISSPSARTASVKDLKDEVDEYGNTIKQLDNSILQQGNSIIQIENNINQQQNTINQHDNLINQQGNTIQQLDNTIVEQGNTITSMNNTVTEHGNQITSINNTVTSQGNDITSINNKVDQQNNVITQQGNVITQHGTTIETFNSNIQVLNSAFKIENGVLTGLSEIIVEDLETNNLDAKYADIDFANINMAAVEKLFTDSGIIKDLVVSEGKITGELVGVTIKGDLIEGNTVKADKLVVLGSDGLYYKLNVNALGEATASSDEKYQNGLDGSVLIAKSVTAEKVQVKDLVAFGATIGGFHITDNAIYSGAKSGADSNNPGIYQDKDGQFVIGDGTNFVKFHKDQNGNYKLDISADSITFGSEKKTVESIVNDVKIGGRNYILNSANLSASGLDSEAGSRKEFQHIDVGQSYMNIAAGTEVTISFDLEMVVNFDEGDKPWLQVYNHNYKGPKTFDSKYLYFDANVGDVIKQRCSFTTILRDNANATKDHNFVEFYSLYDTSNWFKISNLKLEIGNKATDWTPAPEDAAEEIEKLNATADTTEERVATLETDTDSISASVSNIETSTNEALSGIQSDVVSLTEKVNASVTASDVQIAIQSELSNGVSKVTTTTGFTFDDDGLSIVKSGSDMLTNIDEDGMSVYRIDKQLYNINDVYDMSDYVTIDDDGWVTMSYDNTNGTSPKLLYLRIKSTPLVEKGTTYKSVTQSKNVSYSGDNVPLFHFHNTQYVTPQIENAASRRLDNMVSTYIINAITKYDNTEVDILLDTTLYIYAGSKGSVTFRTSIWTDTSVTSSTFVYQPFKNNEVLTANSQGVIAHNLQAKNFLIIGENSRFEDWTTGRTGCFWIGG